MNAIIIIIFMLILTVLAWALFGGGRTEVKNEEKPKTPDNEPEKILRRRASDRAIEEEFPERRSSDDISHEIIPKTDDSQAPFELPYSANSIIPDNSRFRMYKRTLINSEIYARKGNIDTAISLFNGVKDRISDKGIRSKIDANIDYLNHFREMKEKDEKKRFESLYSGQMPGELRLKIDGPVPQTINIGMPEKSIDSDEVIRKISEQIASELGHIKDEIDNIKAKPEERRGLDDFARFASLQSELDSLKDKFEEINAEKDRTLAELERIRRAREEELALNRERTALKTDTESGEILKDLKHEIRNLSDLKTSLDKLNDKIEDLASLKIPEVKTPPSLAEAKYVSQAPVQFDAKPVLDILDKISRESERLRGPEPETAEPEKPHAGEDLEPAEEDFTRDEIESLEYEPIEEPEHEEALFPDQAGISEITAEPETEEMPADQVPAEPEPEEPPLDRESAEAEPVHEEPVHEKPEEEKLPASDEELSGQPELIPDIEKEKEKEIDRYTDIDEDPNEFELMSEYGKPKDDSTLTDEEIFEKILTDDSKKSDDTDFEILGEKHKEEQEYSFDEPLDEKKKAEQDFYKKFIKPDRVKKRELPILKVSYDFKKLPDEFSLSREKNILEYSFYKYKPMLQKADEFIKQRRVRDAINYYKVVADQNIPPEFKIMIKRNIRDLIEYLEKYLTTE